MKPVIAAKAKENQGERTDLTSVRNLTNVDTKKEIAKAAGVSHDTIAKVEKIEAQASPESKAALRTGDMSINAAYNKVQQAEITAQVTDEPLPEQPKTKLEVAIDGTFGGGNFRQCPRRYRPTDRKFGS